MGVRSATTGPPENSTCGTSGDGGGHGVGVQGGVGVDGLVGGSYREHPVSTSTTISTAIRRMAVTSLSPESGLEHEVLWRFVRHDADCDGLSGCDRGCWFRARVPDRTTV